MYHVVYMGISHYINFLLVQTILHTRAGITFQAIRYPFIYLLHEFN